MTDDTKALITNLTQSDATQAAEEICNRVKELAERYGWTPDVCMAVAEVILDVRKACVVSVSDSFRMVLMECFRGETK